MTRAASLGVGRAERIRALLAAVPDPEIPAVSVLDLGIVREIDPAGVGVVITPTYTGCPATEVIARSIREALDAAGLGEVRLTSRLDPPWTTDWITSEGREKLAAFGIAPPPASARLRAAEAPTCPRCDSAATSEVSRFGSTPCKALWRCADCGEPFDLFKCH
ncbi:MAG: 1,2-phenylacetyl-CoA epoxidase subunit PaaD [Caulobacteraceae bacterium]